MAAALGVARQTVSDWFTSNAGTGNTSTPSKQKTFRPDARVGAARGVKVPRENHYPMRPPPLADLGLTKKESSESQLHLPRLLDRGQGHPQAGAGRQM